MKENVIVVSWMAMTMVRDDDEEDEDANETRTKGMMVSTAS
jgi:hypothetical protein